MKRATTDPEVLPLPDEEAVEVNFIADLRHMGKYWKLTKDGKRMEEATPQEITDSDVDAEQVALKRQTLLNEIQVIATDIARTSASTDKMTQYFIKLNQLRK
jgi:hypothetical protein